MKKVLYSLLCACAFCSALTLTGCQKDAMTESIKKLTRNKPELFSEITAKGATLNIVFPCEDGLIGNLEQAHANMIVAENDAFFKKVCDAVKDVEQAHIKLIYKSNVNGDEQVFDFSAEDMKPLIDNPEKTIQESQEELKRLEE